MRDGVEALRAAGLEVRVVSPADFRHYGIAYGDGIVNNLRAAPWKLLALPLFLLAFARAARRALARRRRRARALAARRRSRRSRPGSRSCSSSGAPTSPSRGGCGRSRVSSSVARASSSAPRPRSPRTPARSARATSASSRAASGSRRRSAAPDEPPHVLYVGRLSEEKGVRELAEAARGLPLVVVGDGPLRALFPQAIGFVPPRERRRLLRAGRGGRRAVAAGGLRRRRARGDGVRAAGGRDPGRRARGRRRGRRDGAARPAGRRRAPCDAALEALLARRSAPIERSGRPRARRCRQRVLARSARRASAGGCVPGRADPPSVDAAA